MNAGPQVAMWYYQLHKKQRGPVTEAALHEQVRLRCLAPNALVRQVNDKEWISYEKHFQVAAPPRVDGTEEVCCFVCRKGFPRTAVSLLEGRWVCDACRPAQSAPFMAFRVWRQGKYVIMVPDTLLPPRCVVCNHPASHWVQVPIPGRSSQRRSFLDAGNILKRVLLHLLIGHAALVVDAYGENLDVGLCGQHYAKRRRRDWISIGIIAAGLPVLFAGIFYSLPILLWLGGVVFLAALIHVFISHWELRVESDAEGYLRVYGPGPEFLASLAPLNRDE